MTRSKRFPAGLLGVALLAALLVTGCGDEDASVDTQPADSRPTGPDEVVVQVLVAGGFLPAGAGLGTVPTLTVMGDGTVISQGPVPAIFPGPAITPLQTRRVEARRVDDLVRRAFELGLLSGPLEFGSPPVADAPDTTVTITAGGSTHRHTATALGISDDAASGDRAGLGEQEVANRRALKEFLDATQQLPPGDTEWQPEAIAAYVLGDYETDPQLPQPEAAWPLPADPSTSGGTYPCTLFRGDDARALRQALARANERTPWVIGGRSRSLAFRPVVPGQPGCPS